MVQRTNRRIARPINERTNRNSKRRWSRTQTWWAVIILVFLFVSSIVIAEVSHAASVAIIGLGESVRIDAKSGDRVHISDGGVVRSRVIGSTVVLTGKRIGRTTLRMVGSTHRQSGDPSSDRTVVVTERKTAAIVRKFQSELDGRRGLRLSFEALPDIVVTGELLRLEDWLALVTVAKRTDTEWTFGARIFADLRNDFAKSIDRELDRIAWPGQAVEVTNDGVTLMAGSESAKMSAEQKKLVAVLGLKPKISTGLAELEPMVKTRIVLAEIRRSRMRKIGVRWPTSAEATLLPTFQGPSLTVMLEALEDEGDGRILAMPTLLCKSGGEAKFLAGGEIPIKIANHRTSHVEWKQYGIQLNVQPKADRRGRMQFKLGTEISTLDGASAADGVPGILSNRIETQFNLRGPETIVLSGLIKREEAQTQSGLPLLRSIPILGTLFQSEDFRRHLTELIVFVTPEVISPSQAEVIE